MDRWQAFHSKPKRRPRRVRTALSSAKCGKWRRAPSIGNTYQEGDALRRRVPAGEKLQELAPLGEASLADRGVPRHLLEKAEELPRTEVEAAVEALDRREDLLPREVRIAEHARLRAASVHELGPLEPAALERLAVERGARIRRRQRDLERIGVDVAREPNRLPDRLARLTRQPHDERAVDLDPERPSVLRELAGDVEADPLLHPIQDVLIARLVADQQEPEPVVAQDPDRKSTRL